MKALIKLSAVAFAISLGLSSCTYKTPVIEELPPIVNDLSFSADVETIFTTQQCVGCHNTGNPAKGLDLSVDKSFASITAKGLINTTTPADSKIYTYPSPSGTHYKKFTAAQAQVILTWIEQGAKDN